MISKDVHIAYKEILITIKADVINEILKFIQVRVHDNESGGMLIGSILKSSSSLEINDFTIPMMDDKASRYTFKRDKCHNEILEQKWRQSNYTKMYAGEWHTHPQDNPVYSKQDIKNWNNLMKNSETHARTLIFIIAGINTLGIWIGDRVIMEITKVQEVNCNGW